MKALYFIPLEIVTLNSIQLLHCLCKSHSPFSVASLRFSIISSNGKGEDSFTVDYRQGPVNLCQGYGCSSDAGKYSFTRQSIKSM